MHLDVVDLKAFYYRTQLGRVAQRAVREKVAEFWPSLRDETVAGYGFATPVLRPFLGQARRVICLMPGQQGVTPWPEGQANIAVLAAETQWPLPTGFVDRLVVMHGLETSDCVGELLDEMWRVLAPGGRALFIVPNRSGLWSRRDVTPFGHGRPYSLKQLETQLQSHRFIPERHMAALFSPPSTRRFWLKAAPVWEKFGQSVSTHLAGGVLLVEASKQVYAPSDRGTPVSVRRPMRVLEGIGRPPPEPVSSHAKAGRDVVGRIRPGQDGSRGI